MPYISKSNRSNMNQKLVYAGRSVETTGDLNYLVTRIIDEYIHGKGKSYSSINDVIGVLECAKLELYRRIAAPYEDIKLKDNGDVYTV